MGSLSSIRGNRYYKTWIWICVFICFVILFWQGSQIVTTYKWLQIDDYVEYFAAGKLNLNGGNPYDPDELLPIQLEAGRYQAVPVMMWNPPWMLVIAMPFSIFNYTLSRTLWILFFIIVVFISINMTWQVYRGSAETRWVSWLIGFTFVPVLEAFRTGQTGPLLLLGVAGFLYFLKKDKYWLAGIFLSLIAIKPHILYLLAIAVFVWCINQRYWRILLGTGGVLIFSLLVSWIVNPDVIQQYFHAATTYPPEDWATPTIGGFSRLLFGPRHFWMQVTPPVLGTIWFAIYWYRNRSTWDWFDQAPIIILVSVLTAAYGWTSDQSVSLVAILHIFTLLMPIKNVKTHPVILLSYLIIDGLLLLPLGNQIWFWWLAPALLIWYLVSKRSLKLKEDFQEQSALSK